MTKRRRSTPEEQARAAEEKRERLNEVARLKAQGAEVVSDPAHRIIRAQRLDVFDLLFKRGSIALHHHSAVRRLEEMVGVASGAVRSERVPERVDGTSLGQGVTQAMVTASQEVDEWLSMVGPVNARLLRDLLDGASALTRWRGAVERITGATHNNAQGEVVKQACENLAEARRILDYSERRGC